MPKIVELPDGSEAEFPDDMDDGAISAVLRKQFGTPQAKPEATPVTASGFKLGDVARGVGTAMFPLMNPDVQRGIAKSVGGVASNLGRAFASGDPLGQAGVVEDTPRSRQAQAMNTEAFNMADEAMVPQGGLETAGKAIGDTAQFMALPGESALARGAGNAALAKAQGASNLGAAGAGVLASIPVAPAIKYIGGKIAEMAPGLVRSAIKPTVAAMKRITGAAGEGLDAKANSLVNFIIENKLTTPDKAQKMLREAEQELQRTLSLKNAPTDAPQRALKYLDALERQANKAGLGDDAATIRRAAEEVFASDMGMDVAGVEGARALKQSLPASEALDLARLRGRLQNRKAYGELKSTSVEASKAIERAGRDAVKAAVPEAAPILQREGKAIQAKEILDRMQFRQGNRDAIGLPAHIVAAGGLAGGVPGAGTILAAAANWLRNNQMKSGILAHALGKAIQDGNAPMAADIMRKLGAAGVAEATEAR